MLLAQEVFVGWANAHWMIHWQHTDPVTGSTFVSNIDGGFWQTSQVDPLGDDAANQPDPEIFTEPPYLNKNLNEFWPVEMAGWDAGRTNEMEIGMGQYVDTMDMINAREAWRRGDRDRAQQILAANPNVGIIATGPGAAALAQRVGGGLDRNGALTVWGSQAARALGFVYTPQELVPRASIPSASVSVTGGDLVGGTQEPSKPSFTPPTCGPFVVPHAASLEGISCVGDGDCVPLVQNPLEILGQQYNGLPHTRNWQQGSLVKGNNSIEVGTVIATFDENGRYPTTTKPGHKHAAIYLSQDSGGIWVIDQYKPLKKVQKRYIRFDDNRTPSNNGNKFSVLMTNCKAPGTY